MVVASTYLSSAFLPADYMGMQLLWINKATDKQSQVIRAHTFGVIDFVGKLCEDLIHYHSYI